MKITFASLGLLAVLGIACSSTPPAGGDAAAPSSGDDDDDSEGSGDAAQRAITEADVVQIDEERGRLYAMSRGGSLAVVDVSSPGRLALLGKVSIAGEPFEMYRRGDTLLAMTNGGLGADGSIEPAIVDESSPPTRDLSAGAIVAAIDVSDPKKIRALETFKIAGQIADSRLVGDVLYLATYETGSCWQCTGGARTLVTSFDVSSPTALRAVDQRAFTSPSSQELNLAWSTPWKRSIVVTAERMYVGGLAQLPSEGAEGRVEILDITDPGGRLAPAGFLDTAGPIMSRWQLDEREGVVRVISQLGAGLTSNGLAPPEIETFRIDDGAPRKLGSTTMRLPRPEGLKTVRFDGDRAYAITFNQTDPLFAIDLSDPARPQQRGELHMPGWVFHLVPQGDRLIGLGLDRTDREGSLNVSLFDVSDMGAPLLLQRVPFGPTGLYEDYQITNGVMAEDQDRIQKAFSVSPDGLIAVPFSGKGGCASTGGVQLLELREDTLTKRALLPIAGNPRRALRRSGELLAVSDSHVRSFSLERTDVADMTAEVTIGACLQRTPPISNDVWREGPNRYNYEHDSGDDYYRGCSMGAPSRTSPWSLAIGVAFAALALRRRRAS